MVSIVAKITIVAARVRHDIHRSARLGRWDETSLSTLPRS